MGKNAAPSIAAQVCDATAAAKQFNAGKIFFYKHWLKAKLLLRRTLVRQQKSNNFLK